MLWKCYGARQLYRFVETFEMMRNQSIYMGFIQQSKVYGQIGMPGVLAQVVQKSGPERTPMALRHARATMQRQDSVDAQTLVSAYHMPKNTTRRHSLIVLLKYWMTMYPKLARCIFGWAGPAYSHRKSGLGSVALRI